jgi:hypothetical protein
LRRANFPIRTKLSRRGSWNQSSKLDITLVFSYKNVVCTSAPWSPISDAADHFDSAPSAHNLLALQIQLKGTANYSEELGASIDCIVNVVDAERSLISERGKATHPLSLSIF